MDCLPSEDSSRSFLTLNVGVRGIRCFLESGVWLWVGPTGGVKQPIELYGEKALLFQFCFMPTDEVQVSMWSQNVLNTSLASSSPPFSSYSSPSLSLSSKEGASSRLPGFKSLPGIQNIVVIVFIFVVPFCSPKR